MRTFIQLVIVMTLLGVVGASAFDTRQDRKEWAAYAKSHNCYPHAHRPTVRVYDNTPNGRGGMVYVDGIMWRCADGSEQWRPIDMATAHMIPITQPLSPRARDWYSIPALKLP